MIILLWHICNANFHRQASSPSFLCVYVLYTDDDPVQCEDDQMKCADSNKCILHVYVCDGVDNCGDGSDEQSCHGEEEMGYCSHPGILNL